MKKFALATIVAGFALSACSDSAEYPAECKELIDLTFQAAELSPEVKAGLGMDKETMLKVSTEAWAKMSEAERSSAITGCKAASSQMKSIIDAAKAQK